MNNGTKWYSTSLGRFRIIAICEGISFLTLLLIAMPLKYLADMPQAVIFTGWVHGFLFILYMLAGLMVMIKQHWGIKKTALAVFASIIPFGTFILDKKLLQKELAKENISQKN